MALNRGGRKMERTTQSFISTFFISITLVLLSHGCNSQDCQELNNRSAQLIDDYYFDNNRIHLDSALIYIEEVIKACPDKYFKLLSIRRLAIYALTKDFDKALNEIKSLSGNIVDLPYYNDFLYKRFLAMKALNNRDTITCNRLLRSIILDITQFITIHKLDVDSVVKLDDLREVLRSSITFPLVQYYYYRSLLYGYDSIFNEINNNYNNEGRKIEVFRYIQDNLKMDFMDFNGY